MACIVAGARLDDDIDPGYAHEIAQWMIDAGRIPPPDKWVDGMVAAQSFDWLNSF
jgi:hypothetical protein